jgi:dCMP deaminase
MIYKWEYRFLGLAKLIASYSKDPSTQTGAVIVRPDNTICSAGYNGFPKAMPDKLEWYANREEKYSRIIHCEMNALLTARERVDGYTLYTYPFASCDRCAVHMLQAGITRFVFPCIPEDKIDRWADSLARTKQYFTECRVEFTEIDYV